MPAMPEGAKEGILKGIYKFRNAEQKLGKHVQLMGSSCIMQQVMKAQEMLKEFGVSADIWGVTSYQQLRNDATSCERHARLHPEAPARIPYVTQVLSAVEGPFIAASDYIKHTPARVERFIPGTF